MGIYKKAVITNAGRALMARSIAGEIVMQFSRAVTSSHIYPSDTDFKGYTSLEGIQQTVIPSNVQVVNDTLISVRGLFGNESVSESYLIQNIGLYATDGNEEILFSVSQATTPDEMPAYNGVAPSSFIYTIQATVLQANSLSLTINPAGTATTQDILDLDGAKLDKSGDISETVVETLEPIETKFPIPSAGETIKRFMGKVWTFLTNIKPLEEDVTYYVATTGSDTTGNGTQGNPFKTIQHAVDVIPSDLGSYTANVIVANGTYNEVVIIQNKNNGALYVRSNTPSTVSSNVSVSQIRIGLCGGAIYVQGIALTITSDAGLYTTNSSNVVGQALKIVASSNSPGVIASSTRSFRINTSEISNRSIAVRFNDSYGYVSTCTGSGNGYSLRAEGSSTIYIYSTTPSSTNGNSNDGGQIIYQNGTQISAQSLSGISCTWANLGTSYYVKHGSPTRSIITIQMVAQTTTTLSANTDYTITGFPKPASDVAAAVGVSTGGFPGANAVLLQNDNAIHCRFGAQIASGVWLQLSCTYLSY